MGAAEIIQLLALVQAMTPVLQSAANGIKQLTGEDVDIENMSIADLNELKSRLENTHPDNWPTFKFKSTNK